MKKIKQAKIAKQPKRRKPVKKNSWYRNFRAMVLRLDRRQKNDTPPVILHDAETLVCQHCGVEYTGAFCPKCGMPARWKRFNWKLLFLNFMDIWGLGNRPMFRTVRDLFWRPGYMIRDYLRGHHLSYFPPFKMLAVWTVLLLFMMWLLGHFTGATPEDATSFTRGIKDSMGAGRNVSSTTSLFLGQIEMAMAFLQDHMLYSIIVRNILVVLAVKWAFSKVSDFNMVETFISQIYINCQFHILAFISMLLTWSIPGSFVIFPYLEGLINPAIVLTYDFHQLYGITWKKALWKTIVVTFNLLILYGILVLLLIGVLLITERMTNPSSPLFSIKVN